MTTPPPKEWLLQVFDAQQVDKGGIVRRSRSDVEKFASFDELLAAVKSRGFHLVETGDQFVIFCHEGSLQIHC